MIMILLIIILKNLPVQNFPRIDRVQRQRGASIGNLKNENDKKIDSNKKFN